MRFTLVFALFAFSVALLSAQSSMYRRLSFPVTQDGKSLRYPFAGGLNAGQLSAADLNQDGIQDLVIFDRAGDVFLSFLNGGKAGELDYTYAPDYACFFPKLYDFVLLRDFNGDGAADIFTASDEPGSQEVEVYQGYFENKTLKFKQFYFTYPPDCINCNPLHIYYPGIDPKYWNNLPIVNTDYPDVDDIDGDGDLDILTFAATVGGNIWWMRNTSVESGWGRDSLHFVLQDRCWGRFYESGQIRCKNSLSNNSATCADSLTGGVVEDRGGEPKRHPGSTVMTYDQNGDGVKEVVLGDVSFDCLNMMFNGGTPTHAWMIAQDTAFPSYDESVDLPVFPVSFYLDLDNDGRKDMAVAPNVKTLSEDIRCLWWYKNVGSATNHIFELQTKSLFVNEMIDIGYGSRPAVADVNGDGLLDIVVGNY
ncbi:MAG TPA: VCBS repeat-containing protein, partial [Saprospiraceae bacterium]|nr:VCBS repeat-containing protein [Saprospiraceae bacterium]